MSYIYVWIYNYVNATCQDRISSHQLLFDISNYYLVSELFLRILFLDNEKTFKLEFLWKKNVQNSVNRPDFDVFPNL